jgi:hypothetical protein
MKKYDNDKQGWGRGCYGLSINIPQELWEAIDDYAGPDIPRSRIVEKAVDAYLLKPVPGVKPKGCRGTREKTVSLPGDTWESVIDTAGGMGISKSRLVEWAVTEYLKKVK